MTADPAVPFSELAAMRRQYATAPLRRADLAGRWQDQFARWLSEATAAEVPEPNAMVLATADADGRPSTRTVLLKGVAEDELVFYTNYGSRKGADLARNPWCSVTFPWIAIGRQVTVTGRARRGTDEDADAYFGSRPYGSRIGALASEQSRPIASRELLEQRAAEARERHPEDAGVPRPHDWGGFRIAPVSVEFWQGRADRLHDRFRYTRAADGGWLIERLAP